MVSQSQYRVYESYIIKIEKGSRITDSSLSSHPIEEEEVKVE